MSQKTPSLNISEQRVVLRDLVVPCHIGITEAERAETQRLKVSLEIEIEPHRPLQDSIEEVVNYGTLARQVRAHCQANKAELLETLAAELAEICLAPPQARSAAVRIEKLDRYSDIEGIGVEVVYERAR